VALEKKETFAKQEEAAVVQKDLEEAQAVAAMQRDLTNSLINITVQENAGSAAAKKATQEAEVIRVTAMANADQVRYMADADATREAKVGVAKAIAIEEQVRAYGGAANQLTSDVMSKIAMAVQEGKMDIVPKTVVNMGGAEGEGGNSANNAFGMFMALLATDKLKETTSTSREPDSEAVRTLRKGIMDSIAADAKVAVAKSAAKPEVLHEEKSKPVVVDAPVEAAAEVPPVVEVIAAEAPVAEEASSDSTPVDAAKLTEKSQRRRPTIG
jgi:hypothetical protein